MEKLRRVFLLRERVSGWTPLRNQVANSSDIRVFCRLVWSAGAHVPFSARDWCLSPPRVQNERDREVHEHRALRQGSDWSHLRGRQAGQDGQQDHAQEACGCAARSAGHQLHSLQGPLVRASARKLGNCRYDPSLVMTGEIIVLLMTMDFTFFRARKVFIFDL